LNNKRLPDGVFEGLAGHATLIVPSAQRQAAIRAAWAALERDAGRALWKTPRVFTFAQFAEGALAEFWAARNLPDRLLPPGAEWALLRDLRREAGGTAEARALLNSIRTLHDWRIAASARTLGGSPESDLLLEALAAVERLSTQRGRKPLRAWLEGVEAPSGTLLAAGSATLPAAAQATLRRLGAGFTPAAAAGHAPVAIAAAENDEHELELIAAWCRSALERDPRSRLLIVDARLRRRRRLYERLLSQTLTPSEWLDPGARAASTAFAIEGGQPLAEFPLIAHALLTLRLLTGRLRFDEIVHWLRLPFLDGQDVVTGAALEERLRAGRKLEFSAEEFAAFLERSAAGPVAAAQAARLRQALATLAGEKRVAADWAPRVLAALRQLGWHGSRPLRSDEQQTLTRWHALLDEYSALGTWLPSTNAADAVATLADLAGERIFDPASVAAPVTLSESHDDPIVRYDGIWVAGLDAAQWPPPPRPDVFIPLGLQVNAGIPWASAAGQTRAARDYLGAWRGSTDALVCSWARLDGDAHRTASPLLVRLAEQVPHESALVPSLAQRLRHPQIESIEDMAGVPVDTSVAVAGGVRPLELQAECGFRAYGERRLAADELETPAPGIDARERGMLLHKALELVWDNLQGHFQLTATDSKVLGVVIGNAVEAATISVFRGYVPVDLRPALEREKLRLERLIRKLLDVERTRASFVVEMVEARRTVSIAGGEFAVRIDRIDFIEGGGYAILDYKSGEARAPRWQADALRDPQLLAYLLAERGRNVQALANVSLTQGRARFVGKSSRTGLLPGVPGMNPNKIPADEIEAAWHSESQRWLQGLTTLAAAYLAGHAPVQPAPDVCRNCHLTVLCRRVELTADGGTHEEAAHD
jgi:probable DNA repair protein